MMNSILESILQYGIAGAALLMMYSITYSHLGTIRTTLGDIEDLLKDIIDLLKS